MKYTYYGHSAFAVFAGGKHLLFDPFISGNPLAGDINIDGIEADYIFITHGHYDHILDAANIANRTGALVISPYEVYAYLGKQGLKNIKPINTGGKLTFDFGSVKAVAASHSSSFSDGSYAGVVCGFVLTTADGNFYYSGDTALTLDMTLIPKWADLNFAALPIGDGLTMGLEDAFDAAAFVKTRQIIGVHYDTFEPVKLNKANAISLAKKSGVTLLLPEIGETIEVS
jgi:L-ascorbate metabolism protein UlaG (beta-lactamase superfamily)